MQEIKKLNLEIKKYLKIMPWNYARAIFRARCRMTNLKSNYKGSLTRKQIVPHVNH